MRGLPHFDDPDLLIGAEGFSDAGVYRLRDDLLIVQSVDLTKALGTGFVTTAAKAGRCSPTILQAAIQSMTQLNMVGRDAAWHVGARAATDITGFGLAGHAAEIAMASGVTLVLDLHRLPLLPGVEELCRARHLTRANASNRSFVETEAKIEPHVDPIRLEITMDPQTSGWLLICVASSKADQLVQRARDGGATSTCLVGEVISRGEKPLWLRP